MCVYMCMCVYMFSQCAVLAVVASILVVGKLAGCALRRSMSDLKATQMNMQHSLICKLRLYNSL